MRICKYALGKERKMDTKNRYIGVLNHKGGVGKTFLSAHIIWCLKDFYGKRVVGVDTDAQHDLLKWISGKNYTGTDYKEKNLCVVDGYGKTKIPIPTGYDYVIYDSRPTIETFANMLSCFNLVFVPVNGRLSIESADEINRIVKELKMFNEIYVVRNMIVADRPALQKREDDMVNALTCKVVPSGITFNASVREAELLSVPVWKMKNRGLQTYKLLPYIKSICEIIIKQ